MKFSKFLESQQSVSIFRGQWVTYRSLKRLIKKIINIEASIVDPEVYASQLWWYEIQQRIEGRFALNLLMKDIDEIASELLLLERFIHQAKQLLLKITKKNDKKTNYKVSTWILIRLEKEDFWNPKLGDLVIGISDAYAIARNLQNSDCGNSSDEDNTKHKNFGIEKIEKNNEERENVASQDFVRKNEKYFIRPEDVLLVKMAIAKHLPVDIFGRKNSPQEDGTYNLDLESLSDLEDSTVINSIYLDNDDKLMYHERTGIETKKGNLIRVRWYGSHPNPPKECFMERKTRQKITDSDSYKIDEAIKERFLLNQSNIMGYMTGEWHMEKKVEGMRKKKQISKKDAETLIQKANSIQEEIVSKSLKGVLRTVVRRSAFQVGRDQSLRISLDSNLHIINEDVEKSGWARDLSNPIRLAEVKTLPYAILEVKTQTPTPPEWLKDLVQSGLLIQEGAHFSKFQYGSCKLSPSGVRFTPVWWPNVTKLELQPPVVMPLSIFCSVSPCKQSSSLPSPTTFTSLPSSTPPSYSPTPSQSSSLTSSKSKPKSISVSSTPLSPISSPPSLLPSFSSPPPTPPNHSPTYSPPTNLKNYERPKTIDDDITLDYKLGNDGFPKKQGWGKWEQIKSSVTSIFGYNSEPGFSKLGKSENKKRVSQQRIAKAFFANERTLLSWLNTASFLSLTGLTLLTTDSTVGKLSGMCLTLGTIFFAAYALYKYCIRLNGLSDTKSTKDILGDKMGPVILIIAFCSALLLSSIYFLT